MMKAIKYVLSVILIIALILSMSSCAITEKEIDENELIPIRVGVQYYFVSSQLQYIIDNNIDKKFGYKIQPVIYETGVQTGNAIDKGEYDVGIIGGAFAFPLTEGNCVIVGENTYGVGGDDIYVRSDSEILKHKCFNPTFENVYGNPETVRGKTVLFAEGTTSQFIMYKWLSAVGVRIEDVVVEKNSFYDMYNKFIDGVGDVAALSAPYSYFANEKGYKRIASTKDLGISIYGNIIASKEIYDNDKEMLIAFMKMILVSGTELEENKSRKYEYVMKWYQNNDVTHSNSVVKRECEDKSYVTIKDSKIMDDFGSYEMEYSKFLAIVGVVDVEKLVSVESNIKKDVWEEALRQLQEDNKK